MKTVYIDSNFRCHIEDDGSMTAVDHEFFADKCDIFVEGYCYDTSKGYTQIYPWRPYSELAAAQKQYERDLNERAELEAAYNYLLTGGVLQ